MVVVNRYMDWVIWSDFRIFRPYDNSILLIFPFFYRVSGGGDNGIDIFGPYKEHILIVQCKAYTTMNIGKDDIRAFEGALSR